MDGPPGQLGRYELIGQLAKGGMGTVYLARHAGEAGFQRLFAIKLMHAHLADDEVFVGMLLDEARLAARIHHPNVVAVVDLASVNGKYFVVMEYVDGCSLSALLRRNRERRPPELIAAILIDTLEGLHAAHTLTDDDGRVLNLVHRDVSPQNILIGRDGIGRITDFGIAKAESRTTTTSPGMRKGKIAYMAPEQLSGTEESIDRRADLFAAGAVLWSALTGKSAFRGSSDAQTLHNILHLEIPAPSEVGHKPPPMFDAVCRRALERDPAKRFSSALEMAEAIRDALLGAGLTPSRTGVADWVTGTFKADLEERRKAIRRAIERAGSHDGSVPSIPSISGPPSLLPETMRAHAASESEIAASAPHTPAPPSTTAVGTLITSTHPAGQPPNRSRWPLLLVALVGVPLLLVAVILLARGTGGEAAAIASPSAASSPAQQAATQPASSETATAMPSASAAPAHSDKPKLPAARRTAARAVVKPSAKADPPAPSASEKPAGPPPPKAAPTSTIETNPYLRK